MSAAADHDYPCSSTFRAGLPATVDYHISSTFSGAERRPSRRGPDLRAYVAEIDTLRREIRELRREVEDGQRRAAIAEAELRDLRTRRPSGGPSQRYEGPEVPA